MRRKLECLPNKKEIIKCAMDCMQIEIDKITNDHNEHLKRLFESHNQQISETKKKQWVSKFNNIYPKYIKKVFFVFIIYSIYKIMNFLFNTTLTYFYVI